MKKIRITERQFHLIQEDNKMIRNFNIIIDEAIEKVNAQFGRLAFASVADIIDGEVDLDVLNQEMERLNDIYHKELTKIESFFKNSMSDDEYWAKWEQIHQKMENKASLLSNKINTMQTLIMNLQDITEIQAGKVFSDIEKREV